MVKILYFAGLRETLGRGEEQLELPNEACDLDALRHVLRARGGVWAEQLDQRKRVRAAVNQEMARDDTRIRDGDEVAFFPPVTGG